MHAFSELGPAHSQAAVTGGPFPELVRFLQRTDAAEHPNTGVVAMFFEVSLRNLKYLDPAAVARLLQALLGRRGVQATAADQRVCDRAAYCVLKVVEGTNWKTVPFGADVHSLLSGEREHHTYTYYTGCASWPMNSLPLIERFFGRRRCYSSYRAPSYRVLYDLRRRHDNETIKQWIDQRTANRRCL